MTVTDTFPTRVRFHGGNFDGLEVMVANVNEAWPVLASGNDRRVGTYVAGSNLLTFDPDAECWEGDWWFVPVTRPPGG